MWGARKMFNKRLIFGLLFFSSNCMSMNRPAIRLERAQLAQKRSDASLISAVKAGNKTQVKSWLSNGANPLAIDKTSNKTAYQIANELGNEEIINIFYMHLHPEKQLPRGIGEMVRKYIEDDVARAESIKDAVNNSKAYIDRNPELVAHLIKKKFGQTELDKELVIAIFGDHEFTKILIKDYAKILIKLGANVNNTEFKESPIFFALKHGSADLIRALIDAGVNVNVRNSNGFTPLMIAVYDQKIEIIKMLLAAGADPFLRSRYNNNMTALDIAKEHLENRKKYFLKPAPGKEISSDLSDLADSMKINQIIDLLKKAEESGEKALKKAVKQQKPEFKSKI